jgi:hypothetical protein
MWARWERSGSKRRAQAIARTDIGVLVTEAGVWGEFEEKLLAELRAHMDSGGWSS